MRSITFFYVFTLAFVLTGSAFAEDSPGVIHSKMQIDSLKQLLADQPLTDRMEMEILHEIAYLFHMFDHDSTVHYAYKSLALAEKLNARDIMMHNYRQLGITYCFMGNFDDAYVCFDRMKELAIAIGDIENEINAIFYFGYTNDSQGRYHTAIDYYLKALKLLESETKSAGIGILMNISEINRRIGNTEIAMQYLKQAEERCNTWEGVNYYWHMPHICNEYAFNYLNRGDIDMALHYALKADSINRSGQVNACYTNGLLATLYLKKNDNDLALQYALRAYEWADELKDVSLYAHAGKILSDVYLAQKRYPEAEAAALKVWETDSTHVDESRAVAENIAMANIYMGNTERAAYFLEKYAELNAQYAEKSFQTTVSDMAIKYETEKKEAIIVSLEKERRLYAVLGVAGVLITMSLCFVLRLNQRNARKEKQLIATRSILDGEMKERARLAHDLHDRLSGNLSALKIALGKQVDSLQDVRNQLDNCISDIRDTAHNLMPTSLQSGMKTALEDFAAQFPNVRFHFFGTDRRIDDRLEYVVYCCASELVNNAIKHSGATTIHLQLVQDEKHLTLTVSDDGCGFDEKTVAKGIGLQSIRNRVASCNGKIDMETAPGRGTETTIQLRITN